MVMLSTMAFKQEKSIVIVLLAFIALIDCEEESQVFSGGPNCLIHNHYHQYDYLYSSPASSGVSLKPIGRVDHFENMAWRIEPANKNKHTFYIIQNSKYLCSSGVKTYKLMDLFAKRFELEKFRFGSHESVPLKCEWRFEKLIKQADIYLDEYTILNQRYNEALFAGSILSSMNLFKTGVFLKPLSGHFKLNRFKWYVDCEKGAFLIA
jgi:hypothetical protein